MAEALSLFITQATLECLIPSRRIDIFGAEILNKALQATADVAADIPRTTQIVADLRNVDYLGRHGMRALTAALRIERMHSRDLVLVADPNGRVKEVLALAGIDSVFNIYPTPEAIICQRLDWQPSTELLDNLR